jgi:hypothetical protein
LLSANEQLFVSSTDLIFPFTELVAGNFTSRNETSSSPTDVAERDHPGMALCDGPHEMAPNPQIGRLFSTIVALEKALGDG